MDAQLEAILHSPKLPFYLEKIQNVLAKEQAKRKQFYEEMTEQEKVEFIEGEVIVHSPVKSAHANVSENLYRLVSVYAMANVLGVVHHEKVMIKLTRNDYEPDICFFKKEKSDAFTANQMFFPAPDFVVEVLSESTEKRDKGVKFEDYALHGVEEYWLVHPEKQFVEQYLLERGNYVLVQKSTSGTITSRAIQGFTIPISAIFSESENLSVLQDILKE